MGALTRPAALLRALTCPAYLGRVRPLPACLLLCPVMSPFRLQQVFPGLTLHSSLTQTQRWLLVVTPRLSPLTHAHLLSSFEDCPLPCRNYQELDFTSLPRARLCVALPLLNIVGWTCSCSTNLSLIFVTDIQGEIFLFVDLIRCLTLPRRTSNVEQGLSGLPRVFSRPQNYPVTLSE